MILTKFISQSLQIEKEELMSSLIILFKKCSFERGPSKKTFPAVLKYTKRRVFKRGRRCSKISSIKEFQGLFSYFFPRTFFQWWWCFAFPLKTIIFSFLKKSLSKWRQMCTTIAEKNNKQLIVLPSWCYWLNIIDFKTP